MIDDFEFLGFHGGSLQLHLNFIGHSLLSLTARSLLSEPRLTASEAEGRLWSCLSTGSDLHGWPNQGLRNLKFTGWSINKSCGTGS